MTESDIERIRDGESLGVVLGHVSNDTPIEDVIDVIRAYIETTKLIRSDGRYEAAHESIRIAVPHLADHPDVLEALNAESVRRIANTIMQGKEDRTFFGPRLQADGFGRFELVEKIGVGSQGEVWYAIDREFQGSSRAEVALKIYESESGSKFVRAKSVEHPNVVPIYAQGTVGSHRPRRFIAYQYLDGPTLSEWMRNRPLLSDGEIVAMLIEICAGVQAIHAQFIGHRDLKPSNIMIVSGRPVIIDFGIAVGEGEEQRAAGSPLFMAPEQLNRLADSGLVDIYGIGAIGYWLCTGRYPNGDSPEEAIENIKKKIEPDSSKISGQLGLIIEKCTAHFPSDRYQSVGDLLADLRAVRDHMPTGFQTNSPVATALLLRRHPMAAGVLLTLLVSLTWLNYRSSTRADRAEARADLQAKIHESAIDQLRLGSLDIQMRGGTPDPAVYWMITQMLETEHPWWQWGTVLTEKNGDMRTVQLINEAEIDPNESPLKVAYWYLLHARMQRSVDRQEGEVLASYSTARRRLTDILGESDPIIRDIDDEIEQYKLYN